LRRALLPPASDNEPVPRVIGKRGHPPIQLMAMGFLDAVTFFSGNDGEGVTRHEDVV
jgi:hypothetical protein